MFSFFLFLSPHPYAPICTFKKSFKISGPFGQALFDGHNTSLFVSSFLAKYNPNSKLQVEVEVQVEPGKYI